jgi:hypothetical protein
MLHDNATRLGAGPNELEWIETWRVDGRLWLTAKDTYKQQF